MEKTHMEKLVQLEKRISDPHAANDPEADSVVSDYLLKWIDGEVFDKEAKAAEKTAKTGSPPDVLKMAIQLEKESIAFYAGIREYVANKETETMLSEIIKEEFRHVANLNKSLKDHTQKK
jgi:hypothetical protein